MTARPERRPAPPFSEASGLPDRLAAVLAPVLDDLAFPAERWQVLTTAEMYGVDTVTRTMIERLPQRRYHSLGEVVGVLAAVLVGRPVAAVGQAGPPRMPRTAPRRGPVVARPARPVARPAGQRSVSPVA